MKKNNRSWKEFVKKKFSNDEADGNDSNKENGLIDNLDQINWNVDSELVIKFLTIPTAKNYTALRRQLENCSGSWMTEFLEHDGLEIMFSAMRQMSERSYVKFADAVLQLELVRCIKAVVNSKVGMEFVTNHGDMVHKLALGMFVIYSATKYILRIRAITFMTRLSSEETFSYAPMPWNLN